MTYFEICRYHSSKVSDFLGKRKKGIKQEREQERGIEGRRGIEGQGGSEERVEERQREE